MSLSLAIAGLRHPHIETIIDEARLRPEVKLVAIAEPEPEIRARYASSLGVPGYADHREMLDAVGVDVLGVGAVYGDRGGIVTDALLAGVHVLADKPLCTTLADLDAIERAWLGSGRHLSIAFEKRFYPPTIAATRLVAEGELGDLVMISSSAPHKLTRQRRPDWMFDRARYGGIINDLAVHDIDLLLHFSGATRGTLWAFTGNRANADRPGFSDHGLVTLRSDDGVLANVEVSWLSPEAASYHGDYRMRLVGTKGTAELLWKDDVLAVATHSRPPWLEPVGGRLRPAEDFFDALARGRPPTVTARDALAATRIGLLAQRSADERRSVSWESTVWDTPGRRPGHGE
jgi:predicted dehydrogenase